MTHAREFDVVLWGATGFVGRLTADYLVQGLRTSPGAFRLALAGRSRPRLEALAEELDATDVSLLVADSFDHASLNAIAERGKVILSAVGPYAKYGEAMVAACVRHGSDYCDLTGEPHFVRATIDAHHAAAKETGARIVHCCGYDSIPSDLGTLMVQREFKAQHGGYASQVKMAAGKTRGGFSGGTMASALYLVDAMKKDPSLRKLLGDPYALNPAGVRGSDRGDQNGVRFDNDFQSWTGPFLMAGINTRIVRRSHALLGSPWGDGFRYSEVVATGRGPRGWSKAAALAGGIAGFFAASSLPLTRPILESRLPAPGEGPSQEARERGFFNTHLLALGNGSTVRGLVADQRDPGYSSTAVMIAESALCLALDELEVPHQGGVLTPATAMGTRLIDRLKAAGLTFEVQRDSRPL